MQQPEENKVNDKIRTEIDTQDRSKEVQFSVKMNAWILYDYLLNHEYSSASGIIGTCFGFLGVILYAKTQYPIYLIFGLILIFYLPVNLRYRAGLQMQATKVFKKPLNYLINQDGITVTQDDISESVTWEQCVKAVSTRKSIIVYTGKKNATIFPRKDLGDQLPALIATLAENMEPSKVKIRY